MSYINRSGDIILGFFKLGRREGGGGKLAKLKEKMTDGLNNKLINYLD